MSALNKLYVEPDTFEYFQKRASSLDEASIDKLIYMLVIKLNQIPGIATVWSCSGIDRDHLLPGTDLIKADFNPNGYLTFVVDSANPVNFEQMLIKGIYWPLISFEVCRLLIPSHYQICRKYGQSFTDEDSYSVWSFRWHDLDGLLAHLDFVNEYLNALAYTSSMSPEHT